MNVGNLVNVTILCMGSVRVRDLSDDEEGDDDEFIGNDEEEVVEGRKNVEVKGEKETIDCEEVE